MFLHTVSVFPVPAGPAGAAPSIYRYKNVFEIKIENFISFEEF